MPAGTAGSNARPGYATGGNPSRPATLDGASLPTKHGHAALPRRGATRAYQSDSSSKEFLPRAVVLPIDPKENRSNRHSMSPSHVLSP